MADWYVYHSAETMDRRYGNPETNHVFSTSVKKKLCLNDNIWIVEGFGESPKIFYLAAHFTYKATEYPPFLSPYKGGNMQISKLCMQVQEIAMAQNTISHLKIILGLNNFIKVI